MTSGRLEAAASKAEVLGDLVERVRFDDGENLRPCIDCRMAGQGGGLKAGAQNYRHCVQDGRLGCRSTCTE